MEKMKETVLITGATNGINYELCKLFARHKFQIVIVDGEAATLHNVSEILRALGANKVYTICKELSRERAAEEIFAETEAAGLKVSILITESCNCQPGTFLQTQGSKDADLINKNLTSVIRLTKFYLRHMLQQNDGYVLQLGNCLHDGKLSLLSSATTAFLDIFLTDLKKELGDTGIVVAGSGKPAQDLIPDAPQYRKLLREGAEAPVLLARFYMDAILQEREKLQVV